LGHIEKASTETQEHQACLTLHVSSGIFKALGGLFQFQERCEAIALSSGNPEGFSGEVGSLLLLVFWRSKPGDW